MRAVKMCQQERGHTDKTLTDNEEIVITGHYDTNACFWHIMLQMSFLFVIYQGLHDKKKKYYNYNCTVAFK